MLSLDIGSAASPDGSRYDYQLSDASVTEN
jgi:hypothetical protein